MNARIGINFFRVQRADKYIPLYSPRTSYKNIRQSDEKLLADLTFNFDRFTINALKKQFEKRGWSMRLPEFICVVKEHLTAWQADLPNRDTKLVRCLAILFRDIDINENGDLQWEEFTNYIIEKATVLKNLKSKSDEVKAYTKSVVFPKQKFEGIIPKSVYIPDINRIALFEESSNVIRFMNPDTGQFCPKCLSIDPKKLIVNISSITKDKKNSNKIQIRRKQLIVNTDIRLLDLIYLPDPKYKMLVTSTSDGVVRGWKYQASSGFQLAEQPENQEEYFEHQFALEVYCMSWDSLNEVLYCGLKNGSISMWNLKTDTEKPMLPPESLEERKEAHQSLIMDMITMPKLQFMASGGMDGKLILWDTINHKIKWVYKQHTRGILSLSFNESLILMFSAGFDHQICIWNPYIPTLIHKIQGHLSPILSVKVIQGTNQIVSLDSTGIVKVSDIRRFNNISSFSIQSSQQGQCFSPTSLTVIPKPLKLCFTGRSVVLFQYDKSYNPCNVDDLPAVCCKYIEESLVFVTPSGNKVKIWNALSGDVDKIYLEVTQGEISCFGLDVLKRRMLIGDTKGNTCIYNASNGARMRALPRHAGEVTHIITGKLYHTDLFVTLGTENQIHVLKECEDGIEHIKSIHMKKECSVSCMALNPTGQILVVSTSHGAINFYQTQTSKFLGGCSQSIPQQITSLSIMQQPLLLYSTMSGRVSLITMPPATQRFQRINLFCHSDQQSSGLPLGIITATYSKSLKRYFIVDQKCYMCCYNMKDIEVEWSCEERPSLSTRGMGKRRTIQKISGRQLANLTLMWSVKTHSELVRTLEYVDSEKLLMTCGYDRKVMIWGAMDGRLVDSLQQNYDKKVSAYVALQKFSTGEVFDPSLKETLQLKNKEHNEFDPFCYFQGDQKKFGSNPDWKLQIDFKKHFETEDARLKQILALVDKYREDQKNKEEVKVQPKLDELIERSTLLQQIMGNEISGDGNISSERAEVLHKTLLSGTKTFREGENLKVSNFRMDSKRMCPTERSESNQNILCTSRFKERFGTDMDEVVPGRMFKLSKKQKQIFGNFKLARIKSKQQLYQQRKQHEKYINTLSKRNLKSKLIVNNQDQIPLSKEQVKAAHKLSQAFASLDKDDIKTTNLFKNVIVKQKEITSRTSRGSITKLPRM